MSKTQYVFRLRRREFDRVCRAAGITTNAQLARHLGVRTATVSDILNGRHSPGPQFIGLVVSRFPGTSVESLFEIRRVPARSHAAAV